MKIGQYCQRQRCRHVELEQFWQAFASRGFVGDSWAFLYYQLFTLFVPFADFAFPLCYALMSRKTTELYVKVFQKVQQLVPQFAPTCAMADFEEALVAGFQHVYPDAGVAGCWFHYAQAIIKIVHQVAIWSRVVQSHYRSVVPIILIVSRCHVSELKVCLSTLSAKF